MGVLPVTLTALGPREPSVKARPRYHELDSLRGCMMMLGVALHAAVAYMRTPVGALWGYQDAHTHVAFDALVVFVHTFRMPVFFVLAGFFAALLCAERGVPGMIRNRARRVLGPLVVGWIVVYPLTVCGFAFARLGGDVDAAAGAVGYVAGVGALRHLQLLHLWFLLDLLLYYVAAFVICRLVGALASATRRRAADGFDGLLRRWYAPFILAVPTVLTLWPMRSGMLETPGTFHRPVATLAAHGVFFAFGWVLGARRVALPGLSVHAWRHALAACGLFPLYVLAVTRVAGGAGEPAHAVAVTSLAVITWLLVFGLTGLFGRYRAAPGRVARYVADASYWCYLVHLPLVAWGSGVLAARAWPAGLKYLVLLGGVLAVCGLTYDLAVRPTLIGAFLNGRRYPRGLPRLAEG